MSKTVRAANDANIQDYMRDELQVILENDQICFRENENAENDYKINLAKA